MSKELTTAFDYASLPKDDHGKLKYLVKEINKHWTLGQKSIIDIGEHIATAHGILAKDGKDGKFTAWVEAEFGLSRQTAYNYMGAWKTFADCEVISQFDATAMYELAKLPEPVVKAAIKAAAKGQRIHAAEVKQLRKAHDEKQPKTSGSNCKTVLQLADSPKPQASVTGTQQTIPASPPGLPSVGTVNRTEQGSQGSGDAGECPRGGNHDRGDDGTCEKCKDPPPVVDIEGGASFDPANIEAHAESFAANFAARVKAHNLEIERFARSIMEAFANPPASVWLDESRLGIAQDQIKSACATIRQAKVHDKPCPKCDGKGTITGKKCKWCHGAGFMPERSYEMAGGQ